MITPKKICILKIASGNYGKISACLSRHYPDSSILMVDLECLDQISFSSNILFVIPGVGAFEQSISHILSSSMHNRLVDIINDPLVPKLAICLGFQILFTSSEETSSCSPALGLDIYSGNLLKFSSEKADFIVNTGFKTIVNASSEEHVGPYYFNHAYYLPESFVAVNKRKFSTVFVSSNGSTSFLAGFYDSSRNLVGTQYHPEMSRPTALLDAFDSLC